MTKSEKAEQLTNSTECVNRCFANAVKNSDGLPIVHLREESRNTFTVKVVTPDLDFTPTFHVGTVAGISLTKVKGDYRLMINGYGFSKIGEAQTALIRSGFPCEVRLI